MSWSITVLRFLVPVFWAGAVLEFFLAGVGVFGADSYDAHRAAGSVLLVLSLVLLGLALLSRKFMLPAAVLSGLMVLQVLLIEVGEDASPWIAALHPLNGLAIFGVSGFMMGMMWFGEKRTARRAEYERRVATDTAAGAR
jgi:heme A synthase